MEVCGSPNFMHFNGIMTQKPHTLTSRWAQEKLTCLQVDLA